MSIAEMKRGSGSLTTYLDYSWNYQRPSKPFAMKPPSLSASDSSVDVGDDKVDVFMLNNLVDGSSAFVAEILALIGTELFGVERNQHAPETHCHPCEHSV